MLSRARMKYLATTYKPFFLGSVTTSSACHWALQFPVLSLRRVTHTAIFFFLFLAFLFLNFCPSLPSYHSLGGQNYQTSMSRARGLTDSRAGRQPIFFGGGCVVAAGCGRRRDAAPHDILSSSQFATWRLMSDSV